jgi:hypothetical protein
VPKTPSPVESAAALRAAVDRYERLLLAVSAAASLGRLRPGAWTAREVLGHLIDSACNNHRRFVTGPLPDTARFDGYDGDAWVARQRYADEPWPLLVALWSAYNRHLVHVMQCTSPEEAARTALSPDGEGLVSVAFLMHDYVVHLQHHLDQIQQIAGV